MTLSENKKEYFVLCGQIMHFVNVVFWLIRFI